ncbi:hypothetical protein CCUG62472_01377 [Mycobacteroides salmoniphilum]|nr:hypothetical protein CCUG62472_01377 [Mycobacteroides salmoniphilum]
MRDPGGSQKPPLAVMICDQKMRDLPWHRVIGASGRPAPHIRTRQLELLRAEGVLAVDGRIALRDVRHGF